LDPVFSLKGAFFTCESRSEDIYILVKITKVLQGEEDSAADAYLKYDKIKDTSKLEVTYKDYLPRLRFTRQTLAFTAFPLFDENEKIFEYNAPIKNFQRLKGMMSDAQMVYMFSPEVKKKIKLTLLQGKSNIKKTKIFSCFH
jgi:hypothetical protein